MEGTKGVRERVWQLVVPGSPKGMGKPEEGGPMYTRPPGERERGRRCVCYGKGWRRIRGGMQDRECGDGEVAGMAWQRGLLK